MTYKKLVFILIFIAFCSFSSFAQKERLADMQGLALNGDMIFELEGYTMTIVNEKGSLDKGSVRKLKKKYGLEKAKHEYKDPNISWDHWIIEDSTSTKGLPNVVGFEKCYLFPQSDDRILMVLLQSSNGRDIAIEKAFMNAFFERKLASYASEDWVARKINFAGREIELGDMCTWVAPQNVHCAAFGQLSWSVFKSIDKALTNTLVLEAANNNSGKYKVEKEENINVLFEGIPTVAKRVTYKIKGSKILLGGRNMLAVYYITQKVRDRYVSCMLTNYIEVKDNYDIPVLLREVMTLSE